MNDTASEAPQVVQGPRTEYLLWPIFWIFFFFILANLVFHACVSHPQKCPDDPVHDTNTHNHTTVDHPEGTETATSAHGESVDANSSLSTETCPCKSQTLFWWKPLSPVSTSRNTQCVVAIFSSLLLLIQLMEGYWIMETLARFTSQGPVDNEAALAKPFTLLSLILSCVSFLFILLAWAFFIVAGVLLVINQYDFIKAVLETGIEKHHAGCQYATKTEERVSRDKDSDLERGTYSQLEVVWESPAE